jgi:hypothetical protein
MLYAHYEEFCKYCLDLYLEKLSREGIKKKELTRRLKLSTLEADIKRIRKSWSDDQILEFMEKFERTCGACAPIEIDVSAESNLWPARFREIMKRIDLKSAYIENYEIQMKALVGRRNGIAHGERLVISELKTYEEFENCNFVILHELVIILSEALENYAFLSSRYRKRAKIRSASN